MSLSLMRLIVLIFQRFFIFEDDETKVKEQLKQVIEDIFELK